MIADVNGTRLSYEVVGQGPLCVLCHSIGLSTRQGWREQVPWLSERYTVLRYDIRGLGESAAGTAPLTVDTFVEDRYQLLGLLAGERAVVMGVSLGGLIAAMLAAAHPEVVQALVVVSAVRRQSEAGRQRMQARNRAIAAQGMGVAVDEQVTSHFAPEFLAARPDVAAWYRAVYLANDPPTYLAIMEHLGTLDLADALRRIRCPTLVVGGEDDEPSVTGNPPLAAARALAALVPQAELCGIAGSRHYPQLDQPAAFNRAVGDFLARHG
jgi:3-oxoadipate enol-lactonase